jgi:6-phosphogluconolactonase
VAPAMNTKVVPGQLVASRDPAEVAREAATRIARVLRTAVARSGHANIALSGGETPRATYSLLAKEADVDWTKVDVFWVDERAVPPSDDRSNYGWGKSTLLDAAGIAPERVHRMVAEAPDPEAAAREYEKAILARVELDGDGIPAFDVLVMGIGDDGHTASLFPGEKTLDERTRLVAAVKASGEREARMTLTVPVIEHARQIFVIVLGADKRPVLERIWSAQGDMAVIPARIFRGCRGVVTWLIDKAAGGLAA